MQTSQQALVQLLDRQLHPQAKETYPTNFTGTGKELETAAAWLSKYEYLCVENRWSADGQKIRSLGKYLKDTAWDWYTTEVHPHTEQLSWENVRRKFLARYGLTRHQAVQRAVSLKQNNLTVGAFADHLQRLMAQATSSCDDIVLQAIFTAGLREDLRRALHITLPQTFQAAVSNALELKANFKEAAPSRPKTQSHTDAAGGAP